MKSSLLGTAALALAFLGSACVVGNTNPGGSSGDDVTGDDGGGDDGGGDDGNSATPRVDVTMDQATVTTELGKTLTYNITATSVDGYAGDVALTVSVADAGGTAQPTWVGTVINPTLTLTDGATQTTTVTVNVPTEATDAIVKVHASGGGETDKTSAVTVQQILTIPVTLNGDQTCHRATNAINPAQADKVKVGTEVRFLNADATIPMRFHVDTSPDNIGIPHEGNRTPGGGTMFYSGTASATGTVNWYCHNDGADAGLTGSENWYLKVE